MESMFKAGVSPEVTDSAGNTLLHVAAQNNAKKVAKLVLKWTDYKKQPPEHVFVNKQNKMGHTALHYCFAYNYVELGNYLLSLGADETITNMYGLTCYEGLDPSMAAVTAQTPEMRLRHQQMMREKWANDRY